MRVPFGAGQGGGIGGEGGGVEIVTVSFVVVVSQWERRRFGCPIQTPFGFAVLPRERFLSIDRYSLHNHIDR